MRAAEARFRSVEISLDTELDRAISDTPEFSVRDLSERTYHYKNQVLTWSYQIVRDAPMNGETAWISIFLTYTEPLDDNDDLTVLVRSEIFGLGQLSRVDRKLEYREAIAGIKSSSLKAILDQAFARGADLLAA